MSGQIVALAPATRVASRKLGPVAGTSAPSPSARAACADEYVREDVRQVRDARHDAVVHRRVDRRGLRADPDQRTVQALVERAGGGQTRREVPGRALEQVGARVLDAGGLGAGQRVPADEARIGASGDDRALGRADVADRAVCSPAAASTESSTAPSALTGAATNTSSASATASPTLSAADLNRPAVAAPPRRRSRSGSKPTTRAPRRSRAASPIEPPISPTPTTATFTRP